MKYEKYEGSLDKLGFLVLIAIMLVHKSKFRLLSFHLKKIYYDTR